MKGIVKYVLHSKDKRKTEIFAKYWDRGGTEALIKGLKKDLSEAHGMLRGHLDAGGTTIPENDAFYLASYYVDKALDACPDDIPGAYMRCSLAIHELKAFPDNQAAVEVVHILEDVYHRLEQLQRDI